MSETQSNAIRVLKRYIRAFKTVLVPLLLISFTYNHSCLSYRSLNVFNNKSKKDENDAHNTLRESIIGAIINNKVPLSYYRHSSRWKNMKARLYDVIREIHNENEKGVIETINCMHKGGRGAKNDFVITINDVHIYTVEFKFNATCVVECPQFVSPCKPSTYLDRSFEAYFYDNYLPLIANFTHGNGEGSMPQLQLPEKETYMKSIGSDKVACMATFKHLYDTNSDFNNHCKKIDKQAIKKFIENSTLNIEKLSNYLAESQANKHYICYKDGMFYYDVVDPRMYEISNVEKKENTNFVCKTKSGHQLELKLRFKNGCGLLFPAFQIKQRIPTVKVLRNICKEHGIAPVPHLKKDILAVLNERGIVY